MNTIYLFNCAVHLLGGVKSMQIVVLWSDTYSKSLVACLIRFNLLVEKVQIQLRLRNCNCHGKSDCNSKVISWTIR
jgi:hypothetical protein